MDKTLSVQNIIEEIDILYVGNDVCIEREADKYFVLFADKLCLSEELNAFLLPDNRSEDYIFVFSYALDPKMYDYANMLSLKSGYKIVALSSYNAGSYVNGTKMVKNVSPVEWLELFNKAKLVITDSFHGMMFSIVLTKPFYAYTPNRSNVARVKDILKKFGIEDRKLTV